MVKKNVDEPGGTSTSHINLKLITNSKYSELAEK